METGWLILIAILVVVFTRFMILSYKDRKKNPAEEKPWRIELEKEYLIKKSKGMEYRDVHPPRQDTKGKRRHFYGEQVCGHDRNYLKAALKAYIKGHYYFFYHSKQFRTPEIWK
jgi:hypothetical protein